MVNISLQLKPRTYFSLSQSHLAPRASYTPVRESVHLFAMIAASGYPPISLLDTRCGACGRVEDDESQSGGCTQES